VVDAHPEEHELVLGIAEARLGVESPLYTQELPLTDELRRRFVLVSTPESPAKKGWMSHAIACLSADGQIEDINSKERRTMEK
jgi:hypothetical protein